MFRIVSTLLVGWSSLALAQNSPAPPAPPPALQLQSVAAAEPAPEPEAVPAEPKMRKVCHTVEVVGSSIPRSICTMKPVRTPKPPVDR